MAYKRTEGLPSTAGHSRPNSESLVPVLEERAKTRKAMQNSSGSGSTADIAHSAGEPDEGSARMAERSRKTAVGRPEKETSMAMMGSEEEESVTLSVLVGAHFSTPTLECPKPGPWCSAITLFCVLMIVLFMVFMSLGTSYDTSVFLSEEDTVLVVNMSTFWHSFVDVQQHMQQDDEDHYIQLRFLQCSNLTTYVRENFYQSNKTKIKGRQLMISSYSYLLAGSSFNYTLAILLNENIHNATNLNVAMAYIFNSKTDYFDYLHGIYNATPLHSVPLLAGMNTPASNNISFRVDHAGYYFVIAEVSQPVHLIYQYNMSEYVVYMNLEDYPAYHGEDDCDSRLDSTCSLNVKGRVLAPAMEYCLIGKVQRWLEDFHLHSNTTHIRVVAGRNYGILLMPTIVTLTGAVVLATVFFTGLLFRKWRARKKFQASSDSHAHVQYHKLENE